MKKYITRDKLADFVDKMWAAGVRVDIEPQNGQVVVHLSTGKYEWVPVYEKTSYDALIASLLQDDHVDEQ